MRSSLALSLRRTHAVCLLAILSLTVPVQEVHAAWLTRISDLRYPRRVVLGASGNPSTLPVEIPVTFTVSWTGARSGDDLLLGIANLDADYYDYADYYADGRADMSSCAPASLLGPYSTKALCTIEKVGESGQEYAKFLVQLRRRNFIERGIYHLSVLAWLADATQEYRTGSSTRIDFSVEVATRIQLTVKIPTGVTLAVDGTAETSYADGVSISLLPGAHTISVPDMVPIDNMTRLRFDHWADGATSTDKFVTLDDDAQFEAIYVKQFQLAVSTPYGNSTGAGWYDEGTTATFLIMTPEPMNGLLGLLGGKYVFDHWSGDSASSMAATSVIMDGPRTVTAAWRTDNSTPYIVIGALGAVIVILVLVLLVRHRKASVPTPA